VLQWLRMAKVVVLALFVAFLWGFVYQPGRSEPAAPAAIPDVSLIASDARRVAEVALAADADAIVTAAESARLVAQSALLSAQQRASAAMRGELIDMRGEVPSRVYAHPTAPTAQPTPIEVAGQTRVPILMYHHVADAPQNADAVRRDLSVGPAAFAAQMDYLLLHGYHTISLADLAGHLLKGSPLPSRSVVLTFDDGYDDNYTFAYPILLAHGFSGTFFIITDFAGNAEYMSWPQIVEMSKHGMTIDPHSRTHPDLTVTTAADVRAQVAGSRAAVEENTRFPALFFCYPSGRYDASTIAAVRAAGYSGAVTTAYGATHTASGIFELERVRLRGADTINDFVAKLTTAP
jgi:peptidoglycan/xylan/chitin deacetylase (PgdA/CDA1 family)